MLQETLNSGPHVRPMGWVALELSCLSRLPHFSDLSPFSLQGSYLAHTQGKKHQTNL